MQAWGLVVKGSCAVNVRFYVKVPTSTIYWLGNPKDFKGSLRIIDLSLLDVLVLQIDIALIYVLVNLSLS